MRARRVYAVVVGGEANISHETDRTAVAILEAVVHLIEERGYASVALENVAREAHVSLATIYKRFSSRAGLMVAAIEYWMGEHIYRPIHPPDTSRPVPDRLMDLYRQIFDPWIRHPRMLEAFVRARQDGGAGRFFQQGLTAVEPISNACFGEDADPIFVEEVGLVLSHVAFSLMSHVANSTMTVEEILAVLEISVRRLTSPPAEP